jgi:flavin reductase (DIM6/NTAB) family NADH-FMN oxidoreductase RutF
MPKKKLSARLLLGPVPAALISCGHGDEKNMITLAWVGVVNSSPPMISIAVRPNRHSHSMIVESKEFVVNIPSVEQVELVDGCGTLSGKQINKFEHFGVTPVMGTLRHAPMIEECPVSMECVLEQTLTLGTHSLFIGRVVQAYVQPSFLDEQGKADLHRFPLLGFCSGQYLSTAPLNRSLGYTMKKKS